MPNSRNVAVIAPTPISSPSSLRVTGFGEAAAEADQVITTLLQYR